MKRCSEEYLAWPTTQNKSPTLQSKDPHPMAPYRLLTDVVHAPDKANDSTFSIHTRLFFSVPRLCPHFHLCPLHSLKFLPLPVMRHMSTRFMLTDVYCTPPPPTTVLVKYNHQASPQWNAMQPVKIERYPWYG